jgi:spermidine/putrescine transport system ATP-binding protein
VIGRGGDEIVVDAGGNKLGAPVGRARRTEGTVWVGVRPEKVFLALADSEPQDGSNLLASGVVSDVSFIGVSTQYLVRMPWGQELTVFEQNSGAHRAFPPGSRVDLRWSAEHTFLLDADQDAHAGDQSYAELVGTQPA